MSRIEELIEKLCPNGVPFVGLIEVADYVRGVTYSKNDEQPDGPVRVLRANNITLSSNTLNLDDVKRVSASVRVRDNQRLVAGDILICAGSGSKDHIGKVAYIAEERPETFGGFMGVVRTHGDIEPRFVFHLLTSGSFSRYLKRALSTTTINNLNVGVMRGFQIPVPPLPVQREIVRILDQLTQLEAELEAELEARQQQYEYYRRDLLAFGDDVEWSTLGDISTKVSSGGTPTKSVTRFYKGGTIPWLRTQEVTFSEVWETNAFITEDAVRETSAKWIPENCLIVAISGASAGRSAINKIPLTTNQHCCNMQIDGERVYFKFAFYWVSSQYAELKSRGRGARADLNARIIRSFPIPVPSLEEQHRIVDLLDKFDALVNDISSGLPAEIAARRKQYQYYRDQLLTFKELPA